MAARVGAARRPLIVAIASSAMMLIATGPVTAQGDVTAVKGSAYGFFCSVSAFGEGCTPAGPTPTVALAPDASNNPLAASASSARAETGPATIFSSGRIDVSAQGSLGPSGSVTSSVTIANVNASGTENFTASNLASGCSASGSTVSGSSTITAGTLMIDNGDDDPTNVIPDHAPVIVPLPANPSANMTYEGHVHIGNTTDNFRWVFREQVVNADGSIIVNAAHQYLLGPSATGDLILGQVVCGVTPNAAPPECTTPPFSDVATTHPFCAEIKWIKESAISTGFPDGTYRPNDGTTRQAMSAFLARVAGATLTNCTSPPFGDVSTTHPFCREIKWMKEAGISTGFSDGTYRPLQVVTRQAMSAFMARLAAATLPTCTSAPFNDVSSSHPFCAEIKWMKANAISTGFNDGTYRPHIAVTRQAMSAFLYRVSLVL